MGQVNKYNDEGNELVWQAAQQVAHAVPALRQGVLPHPEEDVRQLRLPRRQDEEVRLVRQGPQEEDHRHRQDEAPRRRPQALQEWVQGGHRRRLAEEGSVDDDLIVSMSTRTFLQNIRAIMSK